jgi:PAS domain S-box-containing protein
MQSQPASHQPPLDDKHASQLRAAAKRRFLRLLALIILISLLVTALFSWREISVMQTSIKNQQINLVNRAVGSISLDIRYLQSDLKMLSSHVELTRFMQDYGEKARLALLAEMLRFYEIKPYFDQIRLLDLKGRELIRINASPDGPVSVPKPGLQDKSHRYYFKMSQDLKPGEYYISPLDLNMENKTVEVPFKPVIRVCTPVSDQMGNKKGYLILNYLGEQLLAHIRALEPGAEKTLMLLNRAGYWMLGPDPDKLWGFMFSDKKHHTFKEQYPTTWELMQKSQSGQISTQDGLFTYHTFCPMAADNSSADNYCWTIASLIPTKKLEEIHLEHLIPILQICAALFIALIIAAWLVVRSGMNRQMAEAAMRQTRDFLDSLLEIAPMPIFVNDLDGTYRLVNQAWVAMSGHSRDEAIGKPMNLFFSETWASRFAESNSIVARTKKPFIVEEEVETAKGLRCFHTTKFPLFGANGRVEAVGGVSIDLTDIRLSQQKLKESEERFREMADLSPSIVAEMDTNLNVTYLNRQGFEKFGITPEQLEKGVNAAALVLPDDFPRIKQRTAQLLQGEQALNNEYRLLDKDNNIFHATVSSTPIFKNGAVQGIRTTVLDISARKRMEDNLRASEGRYRALYGSMRDGLVSLSLGRNILDFNPVFQEMMGYDQGELIGMNLEKLTPSGLSSQDESIIEDQAMVRGYSDLHEMDLVRKDGSVFTVNLQFYLIKNPHSEPQGLWAIMRDITAQKTARAELERALDDAKIANRAKSQFLATMSHEIRTPMNAIIGMTNLVQETPLSGVQKEYLSIVENSANQLLVLIDEILDLSRIEAGRTELLHEPFDLRERMAMIVMSLAPKALEKSISLTQHIAEDTPQILKGDGDRLRQVLYNLLSNAIKFTKAGRVDLTVDVVRRRQKRVELCFTVKDTGIGIDPAKQKEIFEPFTQADASTTREYGGSGLGLAIADELVKMMGGKLQVQSYPGQGSTFSFRLELDWLEQPSAPMQVEDHPLQQTAPVGSGKAVLNILLAEDNLVNQKLAVALLEKKGHRVTVAEDGQKAVELFETGGFDLIIMDVEMPRMDGVGATRRIRELEAKHGGHIPIIAMTAHAMMGDEERLLKEGMDAYLAKPIDFQKLDQVLALAVKPGPTGG